MTDDVASAAPAEATTRKADDATRTAGVGLSTCTLPANGEPTFGLPDDELELGLGVHGDAGIRRSKIVPVDKLVDDILDIILADEDYRGQDVAVLVNGLGATPYEELYIMVRRAREILEEPGVKVRLSYVGEYVTSLEMAGASMTLMQLDTEPHELMAAPAQCPMFVQMGARRG